MDYIIMLIALIWTICGIISYGFDFAYFQNKWPSKTKTDYRRDQLDCMILAMFGPFDLIWILVQKTYKYGFKFI